MKKIILLFAASLLIMNGLLAQDTTPWIQVIPGSPVNDTLDVAQRRAHFSGGDKAYTKFLADNLKYPSAALKKEIEGTVYVKFVVDKDGSIIKKTIKVTKSVDTELDAEALRLVKMFPNWTPALQNEYPVMQRIRIPIIFKIAK